MVSASGGLWRCTHAVVQAVRSCLPAKAGQFKVAGNDQSEAQKQMVQYDKIAVVEHQRRTYSLVCNDGCQGGGVGAEWFAALFAALFQMGVLLDGMTPPHQEKLLRQEKPRPSRHREAAVFHALVPHPNCSNFVSSHGRGAAGFLSLVSLA